jgi:hypothetical protein
LALTAALPGPALAACSSSTPAALSFTDNASDGELGLAPEITFVGVTLGTTCNLVVLLTLGDRSATAGLIADETVATYIDNDDNPATGSPQWGGADKVVLVIGRRGRDLPPAVGTWTGAAFSFAAGITLAPFGTGGFTAALDQLGAAASSLRLRVASTWTGLRGTYGDLAPARRLPPLALPVAFATDGAPPAQRPAVSPGFAPCLVPKVRRLPVSEARRRLARAGCRSRVVRVRSRLRPGRVSSTLPAAGTWTIRAVVLNVAGSPGGV